MAADLEGADMGPHEFEGAPEPETRSVFGEAADVPPGEGQLPMWVTQRPEPDSPGHADPGSPSPSPLCLPLSWEEPTASELGVAQERG